MFKTPVLLPFSAMPLDDGCFSFFSVSFRAPIFRSAHLNSWASERQRSGPSSSCPWSQPRVLVAGKLDVTSPFQGSAGKICRPGKRASPQNPKKIGGPDFVAHAGKIRLRSGPNQLEDLQTDPNPAREMGNHLDRPFWSHEVRRRVHSTVKWVPSESVQQSTLKKDTPNLGCFLLPC